MGSGDEVVVTRLDHDANIRPWVLAAERAGATVRWLDFDPDTAELDDLETVLTTRTRLVAVTAASNLLGTRPDVRAISDTAHEVDALVYVDGVHLAPHSPVDLAALGADFLGCSPYKFFGSPPRRARREPGAARDAHPGQAAPSTDAVPERFEARDPALRACSRGSPRPSTSSPASRATPPDRRARVLESMAAVEEYEAGLLDRLLDGLGAIDGVTLHGRPARRTPTVLFSVAGRTGREVYEGLAGAGVNAPASHFYALEASRRAGLGDDGGGARRDRALHDHRRRRPAAACRSARS